MSQRELPGSAMWSRLHVPCLLDTQAFGNRAHPAVVPSMRSTRCRRLRLRFLLPSLLLPSDAPARQVKYRSAPNTMAFMLQ